MPDYNPADDLARDWQHTEGVGAGGFEYSPDRYAVGLPAAPSDNVMMRQGNPTQNQIAVAASSFGYRTTDQVVTVWSDTLRANPLDHDSEAIVPEEGDRVILGGVRWIIKSVRTVCYGTQFVCYVWKSQAER